MKLTERTTTTLKCSNLPSARSVRPPLNYPLVFHLIPFPRYVSSVTVLILIGCFKAGVSNLNPADTLVRQLLCVSLLCMMLPCGFP